MAEKRIVIVGGGFGGIAAALALEKKKIPNTKIILISDKPHFEYHATLYRVLSGHSPLESCVPLLEIFAGKNVQLVEDEIIEVDLENKTLKGSWNMTYHFDYLILALGSVPSYYGIKGLQEYSYSMSSVQNTLKLKRHLHEVFTACEYDKESEDKSCDAHIVVVGGGASGIEAASELATYARKMAVKHGIDPSYVTIDLIHSGTRLIPALDPDLSEKIRERLYSLGVNIFLNRRLMKEEVKEIYLKDMQMKTKTLIWTAGVTTNHLYHSIKGLTFDPSNKVVVDSELHADGHDHVFVVGDGAATKYSGMAQTALYDGAFVADVIESKFRETPVALYHSPKPIISIPVGRYWAASVVNSLKLYGFPGWIVRKLFDFRFYLTILPFSEAITAFRSDAHLWEACPICSKNKS